METASNFLTRYQLENVKLYTNYRKMLEQIKLDLVAIATPSGEHAKIAAACIRKGCHVIIEKPVALSLEEIEELKWLAMKYNVKAVVCHPNRFNRSVQQLRGALDEGRLGTLHYSSAVIRWYRSKEYYKQANWRGTWEQDGGCLMNQCIHNIDLLLWMMGRKATSVMAVTSNVAHPYIEVEDFGLAIVEFEDGTYGTIEGTTTTYPENLEETFGIFGSQGTVVLGGRSLNQIEQWKLADISLKDDVILELAKETPSNIYGFGHDMLYQDMIQSILKDKSPYITLEDGKRAVELILAIYQSSRTKKVVTLPLYRGSTLDSASMFR